MGRLSRVAGAILTGAAFVACNGDPTAPVVEGCENGVGQVVDLQPGQVHLGLTPETARCIELVQGSGRYVVAVLNTATSPATMVGFQLRGNGGAPAVADRMVPPGPSLGTADVAATLGHGDLMSHDLHHRLAHQRMLRRNLRWLRTLPPRRGSLANPQVAAAPRPIVARSVDPQVGATSTIRLVDLDDESAELCSELLFEEIQVRTVYSGPMAIVVEDATAPLAGQMDAEYVRMGEEFEQNMWPLLTQHFGNPLRLNPDGRLVMVFSPRVNDFERGVAGFVISCDFASQTQVPSSNEGEFFYAIVPTSTSTGFDGLTRDNWRRLMRSTLIHEVKHITSFAERISRTHPFEDAWLEEATAMIAEEIWARTVYDVPWRGNVTYLQSVFCDLRPTFPQCADAPLVMFSHFFLLSRYLERVENLSLLGDPPEESGATFYGSGWSFVRWAIDQYAGSEPGFLTPLTQGPQSGIANVEARTGRPWAEMLAHWSLANAVDDRQGFTTQVQQIRHPSWNYRNIFQSLRADLPNVFQRAYPLNTRTVTFGEFTETASAVAGGTAAFFELHGAEVERQVLELRSEQGGTPPAQLRLAVVRVQ